jgi:tetratricopeptide (TPR) repeat protein
MMTDNREQMTHLGSASPRQADDGKKTFLVCAVLVLAVFAAFEGVRKNDFVNFDDDKYVTDNLHVQEGLNLKSVEWAFTSSHAKNWHPLTWISHIIDYSIFGPYPYGHHLVSVWFHIANALLLFLILRKMTGDLWPSAFVAALFGLHPLAVESVAWVAERKDVLSTFFAFLTIWAYFGYTQRPGMCRYLAVVVLFAAGLLSKPMVVTLPFVLILLDYWPLNRIQNLELRIKNEETKNETHSSKFSILNSFYEKIPLFVLSAGSCVVTYIVQAKAGAMAEAGDVPFYVNAGNALLSYIRYISKIFYPVSLAVLYPLDSGGPALWQAGACLLAIVLITIIAIMLRRRYGFLFTGWFWYLGTLVPVIGFVQVGSQSMADRYMYLPGIGIYIIIVWSIRQMSAKFRLPKPLIGIAAVIILAVLLALTRIQTEYWKDSLLLCGRALAVTKNNYKMHNNYGQYLVRLSRFGEAMEQFRMALTIKPDYALAHYNLGYSLMQDRHYDAAVEHFSKALRNDEHFSGVLRNLCNAGLKAGKTGEVLEVIKTWQKKMPDNPELLYWEEQLEQHQRAK